MADMTELVPELLEAGVHFGHQTKRWNPKMRPYIFEQKNQIYIINLHETGRQEIAALNREGAKLRRNLDGILEMAQLPDALVVVDTTREQNAVNEARRLNIPTVAIVDTNADPEIIDYPIAGNDDAIRAIRVILQKLVDAIVSASGDSPVAAQAEMAGVSA